MHVPIENIKSVGEAKDTLPALVGKLKEDNYYILTQDDKPIAALVSIPHLMKLSHESDLDMDHKPDMGAKSVLPPMPSGLEEKELPAPPKPPMASLSNMSSDSNLSSKPPLGSESEHKMPPLDSSPAPDRVGLPPLPPLPPMPPQDDKAPLVTEKEIERVIDAETKPTDASKPATPPLPPLPPLPPKPPVPSPFSNISSASINQTAPDAPKPAMPAAPSTPSSSAFPSSTKPAAWPPPLPPLPAQSTPPPAASDLTSPDNADAEPAKSDDNDALEDAAGTDDIL